MMRRMLPILFVVGCGAPVAPLCVSTCGVEVYTPFPEPHELSAGRPLWSCAELNRAEAATMEAYARLVTDSLFATACARVRGATLAVRPERVWDTEVSWSGKAQGVTWCDGWGHADMVVNNAPPMQSTLAHEYAHVVQGCDLSDPTGGHTGWEESGIYAAHEAVRRIP